MDSDGSSSSRATCSPAAPTPCATSAAGRRAADVAHRFYEGAPDLAIEIVSPYDRAAEVARTVQGYLRAGTRAVWVVHPDTRSIVVHGPDGLARLHGPDDAIDGSDVLPGFSAPVAELLPE